MITNQKPLINTKNTVLFPWSGSKRVFIKQIQDTIKLMNIQEVENYLDCFVGSLNFTINNIHLINAKKYIINDIDKILISTFRALQLDYKKVIHHYENIRKEFYSLKVTKDIDNQNKVKSQYREKNKILKEFYSKTVSRLNSETDIFMISAIFVWKMQHTTNGMLQYKKDGYVDNTSYKWNYKVQSKTNHIEYYSNILNQYNVIIENLDIFELLRKYPDRKNSFGYFDPGYLSSSHSYNQDISNEFHLKLIKEAKNFKYRLYSNEDCKLLYRLKIDKEFVYYRTFPRNSNLGSSNKNGREFLAYSTNIKSINNITYIPVTTEVTA